MLDQVVTDIVEIPVDQRPAVLGCDVRAVLLPGYWFLWHLYVVGGFKSIVGGLVEMIAGL